MNHQRKNKALKSIEGMSQEDAVFALANDPAGYTEEEQAKVLAEAFPSQPAANANTGNTAPKPAPKNPLSEQLKQFTYANELRGADFLAYNKIAMALEGDKNYTFEVYKVHPIKQTRYEGVQGSPNDIVGIRILETTPLKTTSIPGRMVREFNGLLQEGNNYFTINGGHFHNVSGSGSFGEYYLLKKD